jgi:hypothetical protein
VPLRNTHVKARVFEFVQRVPVAKRPPSNLFEIQRSYAIMLALRAAAQNDDHRVAA